jgi:hypothetical protein
LEHSLRVAAGSTDLGGIELFAQHRAFIHLYAAWQQKDRLPDGMLPELSWQVWKAVEEGRCGLKSRELNRLRSEKRIIQTYPASSFSALIR